MRHSGVPNLPFYNHFPFVIRQRLISSDQAHGVGWLEATTARVALTDRRELVHFPMGQQLPGGFIEQAVHVHACAQDLAAHRFKDRVGNSDVVLHALAQERMNPLLEKCGDGMSTGFVIVEARIRAIKTACVELRPIEVQLLQPEV